MSQTFLIITLIIVLAVNILAVVLLWRKKGGPSGDDKAFSLMLAQLNEISRVVDHKMGETNRFVNESMRTQFSESKRLINEINEQVGRNLLDVTKGLTKLDETNKQVVSFADQLQSLQDILKNPKQRGILGEYYLETLLKNVLPPGSYQMQYPFK
ncbi:MAG: DNA recombination protein RmuC, partial [bacterium]|nr:DNA recombination protein RmuC [bacterium]